MSLKHIIFFPGYALLWLGYINPVEWGKARNAAKSARQWKFRDQLAPLYSLVFYGLFTWLGVAIWKSNNRVSNTPPQLNSTEENKRLMPSDFREKPSWMTISGPPARAETVSLADILVGTWHADFGRYSETLQLMSNGSYSCKIEITRGPESGQITDTSGTWSLKDDQLNFIDSSGSRTHKIHNSSENTFAILNDAGSESFVSYTRLNSAQKLESVPEEILNPAVISTWSIDRIRTEINTIYAKHGVEFGDKKVQEWADQQVWYQKVPGLGYSAAESKFTQTERKNVELLADARSAKMKPTAKTNPPANQSKLAFIDGESNFRETPSTTSAVKFQPRKGTTGTLLERNGKWIKLELDNGDTGWAHESNLKSID